MAATLRRREQVLLLRAGDGGLYRGSLLLPLVLNAMLNLLLSLGKLIEHVV